MVFFHKIYLLMLFSYFLLFFPFPPNIFIFIFSLIKAAQKVIENTEKFITLTRGRILTEKFTNSIKLKNEWKWDVGRGFLIEGFLLKSIALEGFLRVFTAGAYPGFHVYKQVFQFSQANRCRSTKLFHHGQISEKEEKWSQEISTCTRSWRIKIISYLSPLTGVCVR